MLHLQVDVEICGNSGAHDTYVVLIVIFARSPTLYQIGQGCRSVNMLCYADGLSSTVQYHAIVSMHIYQQDSSLHCKDVAALVCCVQSVITHRAGTENAKGLDIIRFVAVIGIRYILRSRVWGI